ncbi:hypothetical protein [Variovorax sp. Root434]|uniref:hypothetical protein n=1 Tax=unclassified Variovorax TaxID=663243 RepID=UPI0006F43024|nr:hypothetical protein [Variovorax sp. Root434]KQX22986.1 hypothetical protein ASD05_11580 [Variovorax sp. Root434]
MLAGEGAVAIWNDIAEAGRAEFYAWHLHEHMPERVGIPGFVRGRRYRAADAATQPEFFTLYETASFQVIQGSDYLSRLNEPTEWTRATTAHFQTTTRSLTRVVASHGVGSGGAMLTMRFDIADDTVRDVVPRLSSALEAIARLPRISGAHLLGSDVGMSGQRTAESKDRKDLQAPARWVLLLEACDPGAFDAALALLQQSTELGDASVGRYLHEHTRLKTAWQAG